MPLYLRPNRRGFFQYGWEFLLLGASIDAGENARNLGIGADCAVTYHCDSTRTQRNDNVLREAICIVRASVQMYAD